MYLCLAQLRIARRASSRTCNPSGGFGLPKHFLPPPDQMVDSK